jgi:hypothetical protein
MVRGLEDRITEARHKPATLRYAAMIKKTGIPIIIHEGIKGYL